MWILFKVERDLKTLSVLRTAPTKRAWQCHLIASCHCRLEEIIVDYFLVCLHNRLLDTAVSIVRVLNLKTKTSSVSELIESKS